VTVDGGSEFKGLFRLACEELGIERYQVGPRRPWTNGFVERLQGTILTELWRPAFRRTYFVRVEDMQHALDAYLRYYNYDRPHQGYRLRGRTPAELFCSVAGRPEVVLRG
jgi:transposase InsO family protein